MNARYTSNTNQAALQPRYGTTLGVATVLLAIHLLICLPASMHSATTAPIVADELVLRIDPNRATADELRLLPRIGPKLVDNIIAYRESATARPAFSRPEDLARVSRIGPATVELLRPHLLLPSCNQALSR